MTKRNGSPQFAAAVDEMRELNLPSNLIEQFETAGRALTDSFGIDIQEVVRLGGGSVLAMYYEHRISTDLDFFAKLTPSEMTHLFDDAESNLRQVRGITDITVSSGFLTFKVGQTGISVFTSPNLTGMDSHSQDRLLGVELEPASEILSKKARGRIMTNGVFTVRDFYDFCVVWRRDRQAFDDFMTQMSNSDRDEIAEELTRWRSSPLILSADTEPLISPVYPRLAEELWDCSRDLFLGKGIPEKVFSLKENEL